MIGIFTGLPGSGKSYKLGQVVCDLLWRNQKAFRKNEKRLCKEHDCDPAPEATHKHSPPPKRMLYTNLQLAPAVEEEYAGFITYWSELRQLTPLRDVDVVIDEVATYFDARLWETLSLEMRRWLAQHRKFGIEIYGTAQDFAQCDKAFRRLTSDLLYLTKIIGSRDISATKEPPKYIWGVSLVRTLDPTQYDEQKSKFQATGIPSFMLITRQGTEIFDTRAEVKLSSALLLKHLERECENPDCTFHKVVHV